MNLKRNAVIIILIATFATLLVASTSSMAFETGAAEINKGDELYERRAEGHTGDWANPAIIKESIEEIYEGLRRGRALQ